MSEPRDAAEFNAWVNGFTSVAEFDAYIDGRRRSYFGDPKESNPHPPGVLREAWERGWGEMLREMLRCPISEPRG